MGFIEILNEFLSKEGNSLLIKGKPGAGKTTLALNLALNCLKNNRKVFYFSTRISPIKLVRHFPNFKEILYSQIVTVDSRLMALSTFLGSALTYIKEEKSLVIFDSWDSMVKEQEKRERLKAEKAICTAAEESKSNLIFISEEPESTTIDYLVDGIVNLHYNFYNGRLLRHAVINKLRGLRITNPIIYFTLSNGEFNEIKSFNLFNITKLSPINVELNGKSIKFFKEFDEVFLDGIKFGSCTLFEVSNKNEEYCLYYLLLPLIFELARRGKIILMGLSLDTPILLLKSMYSLIFPEEEIKRRIIFSYIEHFEDEINNIYLTKKEYSPSLFIHFLNKIPIKNESDFEKFLQLLRAIRERLDILFLITNNKEIYFKRILPYFDYGIKIFTKNENIFLYNKSFGSKIYGITWDKNLNILKLLCIE
jgi:RecA-superfamily ATPases implicated in signal transduction